MKIYTKTGDAGQTSLFNGKRVPKHHLRVEAYGQVDELNAFTGHLRDQVDSDKIKADLLRIQNQLFVIGSHLAFEHSNSLKNKKLASLLPVFEESETAFLENEIDQMTARLPTMTHFILPGGHPTVSVCHLARTVCRRAERAVTLLMQNDQVDIRLVVYLNRLSDYLFVLSRYICQQLKVEEIKWIPKK